jgi:hypothetical protein
VCIVGFARQTRELANEQPSDVEIWGMNISHTFLKRWDRWFQVHPFIWEGRPMYGRVEAHWRFLQTCGVPVYMTQPHPEIPTATAYPLLAVSTAIGHDYLTSSTAYALALAITEGVDEIRVVGVHAVTEIEYVEQRPCIEWLLGIAEGRGIRVWLPDGGTLLQGIRYPDVRYAERQAVQDRLNANRDAYMATWARAHEARGAIRALEQAALPATDVRRQYVEAVLRLQRDIGKYNEALLAMRRSGGTDTGSTKLPDLDIPAKFLTPQAITEAVGELT